MNRNGITREIIDASARAFIYKVLQKHRNYSAILCDKDMSFILNHVYLSKLFPSCKFIFMIRDSRAIMPLINDSFGGFGNNLSQNFEIWNELIESMFNQCVKVGSRRCLPVYYEQLVLKPEIVMKKIFIFLNIEWNDMILHGYLDSFNIETLYDWVGKIPKDVLDKLNTIAPMLQKLGYDTNSNKPDYSKPDQKNEDDIFIEKS